ncbi:MAG: hypothetical protein EZS28_032114 [Streblomastix strix]|uniref:Uncharacterized protein n=1 Tax=Streblomastix strix TaxID=222440 RepID=A0A5J4UPH1_9EUKA|nr:MAG: hypothetical protein EZS28_032114 [Streblomastix strix]
MLQGLNAIESQVTFNAVVPFKNDREHHYSIKEIKPESQIPALTKQLTSSGLKKLVCDTVAITVSIKNNVTTEVTANIARYKVADACLV